MIAMQYSFALPADYDMGIIERRIRDKGPMLDGFPRLRFKAYLSARQDDPIAPSTVNLYAPFYLWDDAQGAAHFLASPGFVALTRSFGWPSVQTWVPWESSIGPSLQDARYAVREIVPIAPFSDLLSQKAAAEAAVQEAQRAGALAALAAFNPTDWTQISFTLWAKEPAIQAAFAQVYSVGHVS